MFDVVRWLWSRIFRKHEPDEPLSSKFKTQGISNRYAITAFAFFALQGMVASLGALDIVVPDLPSPISFQAGRAIHLNLSVFWPFIGLMGAAFYCYVREAETELANPFLARLQYWVITLSLIANLMALALGHTTGREYLEAIFPLKIAIVISIIIFIFVLIRTYLRAGEHRHRPTVFAPLAGAICSCLFFLPNIPFLPHPVVDEAVKFWVVHLWEESTLELIVTSVAAALLLEITQMSREKVDTLLWVEMSLVLAGGLLATGHHYYWIGFPAFWHWVGAIASFLQVTPFLMLAHMAFWYTMSRGWSNLLEREKITMGFILSSVFYHFSGAGLIGLTLAIPQWSRLTHGTYLTSMHAHLALFGALGMLVLGASYHILSKAMEPTDKELLKTKLGMMGINIGLLMMSLGLLIAGLLQVYLWRLAGRDFMEVTRLIRPYLALRAAGGAVFALSDLLVFWSIVTAALRNRREIFR